jgi:hypothetical protein
MKELLLAISLLVTLPYADACTHRSRTARAEFVRTNPCPATGKTKGACPGYVVDHKKALACGGADKPSNMQWQTTQDARDKDKWERKECSK